MKNSQEVLSSILKTTQMGQVGIRSLLNQPLKPKFKAALKDQLAEYDTIETEAHNIAEKNGWVLKELNPAVRKMTDSMTGMRLMYGDKDSKSAAMMIQGNTRGMIKSLKNLHHYEKTEQSIIDLSNKLIRCEENNVKQMQGFV